MLKDLKKFQKFSRFLNDNPHLLRDYPDVFLGLLTDYFRISEKPKAQIEKEVIGKFRKQIGMVNFVKDMYRMWRATR